MITKKFIVFSLVYALVLTMFTGCLTAEEGTDKQSLDNTQASETADSDDSSESAEETTEEYQLDIFD